MQRHVEFYIENIKIFMYTYIQHQLQWYIYNIIYEFVIVFLYVYLKDLNVFMLLS